MMPKSPGRPRGTPNKVTMEAMRKAQDLGIDPFEILLLFANEDWEALGYDSREIEKFSAEGKSYSVERISVDLRVQAAKEAVQYLLPKRKALEYTLREVPEEIFEQEVERRVHLKILRGEKIG